MLKHNGITKPEMRGRKQKNGPLSERTKRRRKAENENNLTQREVSWLGKNLTVSECDLNKFVNFTKEKSSSSFKGNLRKFLKNKTTILDGHFQTKLTEFHDKKVKSSLETMITLLTIENININNYFVTFE